MLQQQPYVKNFAKHTLMQVNKMH